LERRIKLYKVQKPVKYTLFKLNTGKYRKICHKGEQKDWKRRFSYIRTTKT